MSSQITVTDEVARRFRQAADEAGTRDSQFLASLVAGVTLAGDREAETLPEDGPRPSPEKAERLRAFREFLAAVPQHGGPVVDISRDSFYSESRP